MKFRFNVNINNQDYLDFNKFIMFRSYYGKKQITSFRITVAIIIAIFILAFLFVNGFSKESFLNVIPLVLVMIFVMIFTTKFISWTFKFTIKSFEKNGKLAYSPESVIEFYDEVFVETTPENKTENKYFAIERISIVDEKIIYFHINRAMSYFLPLSSFESKEQYNEFLEFIKTKCATIDTYKK